MSFASVSNPAPSRGGPGVPPAPSRAVQGLPSVAALSNPTIRAAAPGTQANMSVNVGIMCRPWTNNFQNRYKEGDLLFVHIGQDHVSQNMRRVANLPVLNWCLKQDNNVNNPDEWRFFGVLVSIMDAGNQQRVFGVTVQGRAMVANYWGDLQPLQRVYLAHLKPDHEKFSSYAVNGGSSVFVKPESHVLPVTEGSTRGKQGFAADELLEIGYVGMRPHRSRVPENERDKAAQVQSNSDSLKRIEIFLRR